LKGKPHRNGENHGKMLKTNIWSYIAQLSISFYTSIALTTNIHDTNLDAGLENKKFSLGKVNMLYSILKRTKIYLHAKDCK
jgi:hypothetical protein